MTLKDAYERYLRHCRNKELSAKTMESYTRIIELFIGYFGEERDIYTITLEEVEQYISQIRDKELARASRASYIRTIKCFLNYLRKYCNIAMSVNLIVVPKAKPKVVHLLTTEEITELGRAVQAESEWLTMRNKLIILFMLDSGLRREEVCRIKWEDISTDGTLKVLGKGSKERYAPMGRTTRMFLEKYKKVCPFETENVFVNRRGKPLTTNAIKQFISKLQDKVSFEVSCHRLRHNFATNYCIDQYYRYGIMDAYRLMAIMGHEDIVTTQGYIHLANQYIASRENISHVDNVFSQLDCWTP